MKKQAEAYEQQANGLRQQVDLVNQREKQRVAAIKARVGVWLRFELDGSCAERFAHVDADVADSQSCKDGRRA